jgi:hypothetical protein
MRGINSSQRPTRRHPQSRLSDDDDRRRHDSRGKVFVMGVGVAGFTGDRHRAAAWRRRHRD